MRWWRERAPLVVIFLSPVFLYSFVLGAPPQFYKPFIFLFPVLSIAGDYMTLTVNFYELSTDDVVDGFLRYVSGIYLLSYNQNNEVVINNNDPPEETGNKEGTGNKEEVKTEGETPPQEVWTVITSPSLMASPGKYYRPTQPEWKMIRKPMVSLRIELPGFMHFVGEYLRSVTEFTYQRMWATDNQYEKTFNVSDLDRAKQRYRNIMSKGGERGADEGLIPNFQLPKDSEIKISGRKTVSMGYSREKYPQSYNYGQTGTQGNIEMEQQLQVQVEGVVSRKTHVYIDYDDSRENESRNKISVVYKGDEKEFVQEAAFGDLVMTMPSTEFLSYSSSRSVFGGKLNVQKGLFKLLTIASTEKGRTEKETFTSGKEFTVNRINDTNYVRRKYYVINAYGQKEGDETQYYFNTNRKIMVNTSSGQPYLAVFVSTGNGYIDPNEGYYYDITAYRYDDSVYDNTNPTDEKINFYFKKLVLGVDYNVDVSSGIITFASTITDGEYVAIAYKIANDNNTYQYEIGKSFWDNNLNNLNDLKLIKKETEIGEYQYYELHNMYSLGAMGIDRRNFVLKMMDTNNSEFDPDTKEPYIVKYGIATERPGGGYDINSNYIDYDSGILHFPDSLPFDYDGNRSVEGEDAYEPETIHKMYIYVEFEAVRSVYILRPNIIPGSEEVRINGHLLIRDQDYIIDYDSGYLEFITELINEPDAQIEITYEYSSMFSETSKTLAGTRAEFVLGEDSNLGFTYLGEWSSKPKFGEIPTIDNPPTTQNILDSNLKLYYHPKFMTNAVNLLPLVKTEYPSTLSIESEFAKSFLNPNIVGLANVDDMEGTKIAPTFPMRAGAWQPSSPPDVRNGNTFDEPNRILLYRGEDYIEQSQISSDYTSSFTYILKLRNLPNNPGSFDNPERWGGICRNISTYGTDYKEKEYKYLEMIAWFPDDANGLLHVDLGEMSEDSDSNGEIGTEDKQPYDGKLGKDEDTGWWFDNTIADPPGNDKELVGKDNGYLDTEDFNFNGILDKNHNYFEYTVDIEKVNKGNPDNSPSEEPPEYVTKYMNYYNDPYGNKNGRWVSIRLPLDFDKEGREGNFGSPDATRIKHIRVWVEAESNDDFPSDDNAYDEILLASLSVVGNRWEEAKVDPDKGSNVAHIEVISNKEDSGYTPLKTEYDENGNLKTESSLSLKYITSNWDDIGYQGDNNPGLSKTDVISKRLNPSKMAGPEERKFPYGSGDGILNTEDRDHDGILDNGEDVGWIYDGYPGNETGAGNGRLDSEDEIYAYTEYVNTYRPYDFSGYGYLIANYYPNYSENNHELFFIRFGSDDNNYYEYFVNIMEGDRNPDVSGWRFVKIDLPNLVNIQSKHSNDTGGLITEEHVIIKGNPSLYNILQIVAGVKTTDPMVGKDFGNVWINDISLEAPINQSGYAKRVKIDLAFSDFMTVGGEYRGIDGTFQSIGYISPTNTTSGLKSAYTTMEISKFMPKSWQVSMPISVRWSKNLTDAENKFYADNSIYNYGRITSVSRQYNLGFKRVWLPTVNLNYSHTGSSNEKYERQAGSDSYTTSFGYEFPNRIPYLPTNISTTFRRTINKTLYFAQPRTDPDVITHSDYFSSSLRFEPIKRFELRPTYGYGLTWDRVASRLDYYTENYGFSSSMSRITGMRPSFSYSSNYSEDRDYTDNKLSVSNSSSITSSFSIEPGRLGNKNIKSINSMSISPTYTLSRSSTYYDVTDRPGFGYRFGYNSILHGFDSRTLQFRHIIGVSLRFRPFEFMSYKGEKEKSWDCISATLSYKLSKTNQYVTGSLTRSRTIDFPGIEIRIDGTKNFPIFAGMLKRSSVVLGYSHSISDYYGYSHSVSHSPLFSWHATWSDALKTTIDVRYDMDKDKDLDFGTSSVTTTFKPSVTIDYNLKMPKGYSIPVLDKIFRMRNELDFIGTITYTRIRNIRAIEDNTNRWDVDVSTGYYITTNLRMTITVSYSKFRNLSEAGQDNSTTNVFFTADALF
jgi:hypothetical protein